MDIILETKDLTKTYKAGGNHINAVDHTSICVERGDFVTIVGKSGSGKSTLLHLIGGLDYPTCVFRVAKWKTLTSQLLVF